MMAIKTVSFAVQEKDGAVRLDITQPVDYLDLTPDQADSLATTLMYFASAARKKKK